MEKKKEVSKSTQRRLVASAPKKAEAKKLSIEEYFKSISSQMKNAEKVLAPLDINQPQLYVAAFMARRVRSGKHKGQMQMTGVVNCRASALTVAKVVMAQMDGIAGSSKK